MKYWETERPQEINTGKNILRYYKNTKKLQVSTLYWKNGTGE